jgi:hypothetical protein
MTRARFVLAPTQLRTESAPRGIGGVRRHLLDSGSSIVTLVITTTGPQ